MTHRSSHTQKIILSNAMNKKSCKLNLFHWSAVQLLIYEIIPGYSSQKTDPDYSLKLLTISKQEC